MMESCLAGAPERLGPVEVDDLRRDLLGEFAALPAQQESVQSENLQVYLRIRPLTAAESDSGASQDCVTIEGLDSVVLKAPRSCQSNRQSEKSLPQTAQRFTFTQVFGPEAGQRAVFDGSVRALVRDVLDGGNCLVFTYGVTNAGKTFTFLGPEHDSGLLPRSLSLIFTSVEGRLYGGCDLKPQRCRDYSRLTPDQQAAESGAKRNLLRLFKESDKSLMSSRSTLLDGSALSADSSVSDCDSFCLNTAPNVRFSIWVSFCEIYNDNIHDLLEQVHGGHHRRTVLRLSQDVRGNSFIKDLRWVQVNSSEEAYRVMKIGKKNQSFSSTRLNQLSSRSHSIFSVRILKIDNVGVPRVLGISELSLCDLAGSERCSRTQNTGERLKEAGNINNSLLTLGKCINAMRLNQNAKFQHHIPFRESKLTHFLQFFFCGAGRVSMVVNVNQSASCFDETLNVLKFSALAQKVVVLNTRPVVQDEAPHRSAMELSMIIDEADLRRNVSGRGRKSSMVAWETSLEDVLEDDDGEEWEVEEEESAMEGTVLEAAEEAEKERTMEVEQKTDREAALRLVLEAQIREEVSTEFMELFNKMEEDYRDRLEKEREILEERADKRVEILRNLISRTVDSPPTTTNTTTTTNNNNKEEQAVLLQGIISTLTNDLEKIREDAQSVQHCLTEQTHTEELEMLRLEKQQSHDRLQEAEERLEQQQQKLSELMEMCQQKDDIINKLQAAMDATVEEATRDRALVESIRTELLQLQQTCHCPRRSRGEEEDDRKRQRQSLEEEEEDSAPARKRAVLEEEIWRLQEENDKKEEMIVELREREGSRRGLEENLTRREEEIEQLKKEQVLLEQKVEKLTDLDECPNCDSVFSSLEAEQKETSRLTKENKALVNGIFQLQTEMTSLQTLLKQQIDRCDSQSEQLNTAKTRLQELESQSEEKAYTINRLSNEVEHLKQEVKEEEEGRSNNISVFHDAMDELKKESQAALERSAQKSQQIRDLQREKVQLDETLTKSQKKCVELTEELNNQKAAFSCQLQSLRAELESEGGALRGQLEEMEREQEREREERRRVNSEKEQLIEESYRHTEALRRELERLKEDLQRREEEENQNLEERKEEIQRREEEENQILEERKKEIQRREEEENQILEERKKEIQRREEEENQILEERKEEIQRRGEVENHILEERKEGIQRREEEENQILEERKKEIQRREEEENQILEERKEEIQSREEEEEKENLALEDRKVPVVEELKEVIQKLKEKRGRQHKEEEEYEAVKREVERLKREKEERETRRCGGRVLPQQDAYVSPLRSNMADRKKMAQTTGKKRKSCDVEGLAFSENKRNRLRGNARNTKQSSSSSVKEKRDGTLQKIGDLIHNSPSILGSKAKTIMGLVTGHSPNTETLPTTSKPRRGRRKLYKANASSPLLDSPHTTSGGAEDEEKESDHLIIKRQLRSKTCRK